ncbi:MAG: hypothetical protein K2P78_13850, partial [Gemmataceae bacterium]|nr:hypothetical protein [Gemmataceae bacterium]
MLAGTDPGLTAAAKALEATGVKAQRIPVACGFHSPLIAGAKEPARPSSEVIGGVTVYSVAGTGLPWNAATH